MACGVMLYVLRASKNQELQIKAAFSSLELAFLTAKEKALISQGFFFCCFIVRGPWLSGLL